MSDKPEDIERFTMVLARLAWSGKHVAGWLVVGDGLSHVSEIARIPEKEMPQRVAARSMLS
jgi:hypothetical protein